MDLRAACLVTMMVGLGLAGCLDGSGPGDAVVDGSGSPFALTSWDSMLAGPGGDAESSLAVSADGQTILACSHGGFTQPSPLWASTDGGDTFRRIEVQPNQPFDGDCDVAITADGTWHIVYDTVASATFASSSDEGATWFVHPFTAEPLGGVDRPWILAAGDDVVLIWADVMAALPFVAFFTKTSDHGRTWTPHTPIATFTPADVFCFIAHPLAIDDGATFQVPIVCNGLQDDTGTGAVYIMESTDGGLTWDRIQTGVRSGGSITGSYAGDGGLWLTVSQPDGDGMAHGIVHSTDRGRTFTDALWIDGNVTPGFGWFWVDGRPDGSATAVWMDAHENGTWQAAAARLTFDAAPRVEAIGHVGPLAEEAPLYEFFMVKHDGSGRAIMAFPQVTGPECHQPGTLPSQAGSGNVPRNAQCIYVVREPWGG
ncbi:MAG TPA: sialidase family protein [Candidatus Thermoplasmatota archaeon]|nr:sialidase family protein [Candidatus Thermoplasmatota archaeon]